GNACAFAVALAAGLSYAVLYHTVRVLSDVPFLVPWTAALFVGEKLRREPRVSTALLFALLALSAFSLRVVSLVLVPAALLLLLPRLRSSCHARGAVLLAVLLPALGMGAWFTRTAFLRTQIEDDLRDERSYEHELATGESYEAGAQTVGIGGALEIAWGNLDYLRGLIGEAASAYAFPAQSRDQVRSAEEELGWWVGLLVSALSLVLLWRLRREHAFLLLATTAYLALIVVWPSRQGVRFLLPAFPALFLAWIEGGAELARRCGKTRALGAGAVAALLLGIALANALLDLTRASAERRSWTQIYALESARSYEGLPRQLADEGARALREREPRARLVADQAAYLVYRTGIDARSFPIVARASSPAARAELLLEQLRARGITHVSLVPEGPFAQKDLIEPLLLAVGPAEFASREPRAAAALQAFFAGERPAGGGADLIVPLSAFAR
ncbi:MAG: hypothetical protein JNM84_12600, partial [Planctomycetes bacterium]|nr:hypothetical protein [Planctomycetota bacterium]